MWKGLLLASTMAVVPLWYALALTGWGFALVTQVPVAFVLLVGMLLAVCAWCGDGWAGLFVAYLLVRTMVYPVAGGFDQLVYIVLGLGLYTCARSVPEGWCARIRWVGLGVGMIQAVWVLAHAVGLTGFTWNAWAGGTIGNPNFVAAYLVIATVWAPGWLVPVFGAGILASKSFLALLALLAVCACRFRFRRAPVVAGLGLLAIGWWIRGGSVASWGARAAIWRFGVSTWLRGAPVWGFGLGSWMVTRPKVEGERPFGQAHHEILQLGFEGGLVALALLGAWFWSHRAAWRSRDGLALLAALVVESAGMFPFHVVAVAVLALTMLGFATRRTS